MSARVHAPIGSSTPPPSPPPCVGEGPLFESLDLRDHKMARDICLECPVIHWCHQELMAAREASMAGGRPQGTWAGLLIHDDRVDALRRDKNRRERGVA